MKKEPALKTDQSSVKKMLNLIRFLDEARWKSDNYDIPNYADKNMPSEQKLLTHFLGYITNRRISYKLIFYKLDFIFSQLIKDYYSGSTADNLLLNPGTYIDREDGAMKGFKACRMDSQAQYSIPLQEPIKASSRFFPEDFVGIFCTLEILAKFTEKSFSKYIQTCLSKATTGHEMEFLLYGLWLLGYSNGRWKKEDLDRQYIDPCLDKKFRAIETFFDKRVIPASFREERYKSKRLTCFVRDLLKCDHYHSLFRGIISSEELKKLKNQLHVLELPGDVWNNNEHFQECFRNCSGIDKCDNAANQRDFNKTIRDFYENYVWKELMLEKSDYYPEQFDTTFDFVPRMCEKNGQKNCQYCPMKGSEIADFCIYNNENKFCPFLLYACGYKVYCKNMSSCPNKQKNDYIFTE